MEGGLCSIKRVGCPWFSQDKSGLFKEFHSWQGTKPATQGHAETSTVPLGKEICLVRGPYPQQQSGEGYLWLGQMRPSQFHQMSGQHIIVGLNLRLIPHFDYFKFEICFMAQDVVYLGLCSMDI